MLQEEKVRLEEERKRREEEQRKTFRKSIKFEVRHRIECWWCCAAT
jgi:hypothetical protein